MTERKKRHTSSKGDWVYLKNEANGTAKQRIQIGIHKMYSLCGIQLIIFTWKKRKKKKTHFETRTKIGSHVFTN